jgi:hypothetical protein
MKSRGSSRPFPKLWKITRERQTNDLDSSYTGRSGSLRILLFQGELLLRYVLSGFGLEVVEYISE